MDVTLRNYQNYPLNNDYTNTTISTVNYSN